MSQSTHVSQLKQVLGWLTESLDKCLPIVEAVYADKVTSDIKIKSAAALANATNDLSFAKKLIAKMVQNSPVEEEPAKTV